MVKRRDLLGGGLAGGLLGALAGDVDAAAPTASEAAQRPAPPEGFKDVADAIVSLREELMAQHSFNEIGSIRTAQRTFLRTNLKMPDFLEVGAAAWYALYDWHVRWQQELNLGRDPQGRYTILFMETTVILRPDSQDAFIGTPYDIR